MHEKQRTRLSKFLSLVLRHRPQQIEIELDEQGWTPVDRLLEQAARHGLPISRAELDEVVDTSDKKRFAYCADRTKIRANQGHSVTIDLNLEPAEPPEWLYHGTVATSLASIGVEGLCRRQRHHVHLSPDEATAIKVGQRRGQPVVLRIHAGRMHRAGSAFYVSANGVWLTEHVPSEYVTFPNYQPDAASAEQPARQ